MNSTRAIYPGSFDPVHFGHIDVIHRSLHLFSNLIIAVAASRSKGPLFTVEERIAMLRETLGDEASITILPLEGLLVDFAREHGVFTVIRGLRAVSDFEFEFQMALMNRKLEPRLETVYLTPKEDYTYLSSRIMKEVARFGGDLSQLAPPSVAERLGRLRFQSQDLP
ncbi:MAG: pantetheine-phosphate adenylyltransferase [bacterium]